jgi:hypothetical protein
MFSFHSAAPTGLLFVEVGGCMITVYFAAEGVTVSGFEGASSPRVIVTTMRPASDWHTLDVRMGGTMTVVTYDGGAAKSMNLTCAKAVPTALELGRFSMMGAPNQEVLIDDVWIR